MISSTLNIYNIRHLNVTNKQPYLKDGFNRWLQLAGKGGGMHLYKAKSSLLLML